MLVQLDSSTDRLASGYIGHRYHVRSLLGHGGMARVYRVYDELASKELALKQWHGATPERGASAQSIAQFEYEYITLAQLSHPSMIEVYDYGLSDFGPYFTMELLDGGDLREHAPLPWERACQVFHDICSSLALLHSRRLIHRDISPRNIRCTPHGGAKLIDFGAMLPMGLCEQVVGTPAYAAPEVVQGLPLDARVDLFSLGASLYFALTGKQPSTARDFADITAAAQRKPLPPSRVVADIPEALDGLVLSMLDPNPALRPRSAFEVMQRLAALARFAEPEPRNVAQAYLETPELVGREPMLRRLRERCANAMSGHGGTVIIEGAHGMGCTRVLDVCALWAKTLGATVLKGRCNTGGASERSLSRQLAEQLISTLPFSVIRRLRETIADFDAIFEEEPRETTAVLQQGQRAVRLRQPQAHKRTRQREQAAVLRAIALASLERPLIIAVDDATSSDGESLSLLSELSFEAVTRPVLLVATRHVYETTGARLDDWQRAHAERHLYERAERFEIEPLSRTQTTQLLSSVFGDVPHAAMLGDRVYAVSAGNPAATLEIAQWLVSREIVKYEAGNWVLPSHLDTAELPACAADTLRVRIKSLSPLARELATAQALALYDGFSRATYRALLSDDDAQVESRRVDSAIGELLRERVIESEHDTYTFVQRTWTTVLLEQCELGELRRSHERLARYHARSQRGVLHWVHHLLCAGDEETALDRIVELLQRLGDDLDLQLFATYQISPSQTASILDRCLQAACSRHRPRHVEHLLRRWLTILSVLTREEYFFLASPAWRAQLEQDCGLRGAQALPLENELATGDARVYAPLDALRNLAGYVSCALAIAGRRLDARLMASLPSLLEPFTALSPEIRLIWQVAVAAEQALCRCQLEQARARLHAAYEELNALPDSALHHRTFIRHALAYAIGATEVSLGLQTATRWINELDDDPLQAVNAMYLRRVLRLQRGDIEGAERFRRKAELLSLHASTTQMFTSTVVMELVVHGISGDLLGLKQLSAQIAPLAERTPCWRPYAALAAGYFEQLRGNPEAALSAFEECVNSEGSIGHFTFAWLFGEAARVETLVALGRPTQAAEIARRALSRCRGCGVIALGQALVRALALAEAKLGHYTVAAELLDTAIESARTRGVSGLQLGSLYEGRTWVAIEARDVEAIDRHARLTAREYGYARSSSLGARCERLLEAAALRGAPSTEPSGSSWGATLKPAASGRTERTSQLATELSRAMAGAESEEGRPQRALRLLCQSYGASAGHLYLADEQGLRIAASYRTTAPSPALAELTAQHLQSDLQQRADITRVDAQSTPRLDPEPRLCWKDDGGIVFEPQILHGVIAGEARCAGIAWIASHNTQYRSPRPAQFTSALSNYLLEQHETSGV